LTDAIGMSESAPTPYDDEPLPEDPGEEVLDLEDEA